MLIGCVSMCFAVTKQKVAEKKQVLSARLDSLEMEKQHRKQRGEPLDELERACAAVRDSIEQLRAQIGNLSEQGVLPPPERKAPSPPDLGALLKGRSVFDWVILGVGFVAIVAGIVLVVGIFRAFFGAANRRPRHKAAPAKPSTPARRPGASSRAPSASGGDTDINDEGIESLRHRVSADIKRIQRFDSEQPPALRAQAGPDAGAGAAHGDSLRERIMQAAHEGLDVQQISKRFHISADQVALILRVASDGTRGS